MEIRLVRDLVTTNSLSYILDFGVSDVKKANVTLYNANNEQVGNTHTIEKGEDTSVIFDGLDKNTTYNVVLDSVVFNNTNYAQIYTIKTSDVTLKEKPILGNISVTTDLDNGKFTLKMGEVVDEDNSIVRYTYKIYKADDLTEDNMTKAEPVYTYNQEKLEDVTLSFAQGNLEEKVDYRFKVVAEYYDNYKYNEVETGYSGYFKVSGKPTIKFEPETVDFNQISGTIKLKDEGCLIPMEGRECYNKENSIIVRYKRASDSSSKVIEGAQFVQDEVDIVVGKETVHLSPMFYVNCSYLNFLEYYDKDTGTYKQIDTTSIDSVIVQNDYMKVDVALDKVLYDKDFMLLATDFSVLSKITDTKA